MSSPVSEKKTGYRSVLTQKEYCKLILSNLINRFGDSIDSIAFTWLVYAITNNAAWSAIIFGVNKLPTIFLQPIAGAVVEHRNKKSIMIQTNIVRGICVTCIAAAYWAGILKPWMLIITTLIISSVEAFCLPASSAVIPRILKKEYFEFGISLNASASNIVELIGLGMAGFIIARFGIVTAILIDAATFFGSSLLIAAIKTGEGAGERKKVDVAGCFRLVKEGADYVKTRRIVLNFIVLAVLANAMFVPFNSLQAPLAKEILGSGEIMISVLSIALSAGMLCASVMFPYIAAKMSGKSLVALGGMSFGVYYAALTGIGRFITNELYRYVAVFVFTFIAGFLVTQLSTYINVAFLKSVEQEYLARSAAIMNAAGASAVPLVSFLISAVVSVISTEMVFLCAGIFLIIVIGYLSVTMNFDTES